MELVATTRAGTTPEIGGASQPKVTAWGGCRSWKFSAELVMAQTRGRSDSVGRGFGQLGLTFTVVVAALPLLLLTIALPPWREVECQRRQTLYWSERIAVRKTSFAGFDWLLSGSKWTTTKNPPNPSSEMLFESHEFEIHRPVLAVEWLMLVGLAGTVWYRLAQRVFPPAMPRDESPPNN